MTMLKRTLFLIVIHFLSCELLMAIEPRNLLSSSYTRADLDKILIDDNSWISYPAYKDRKSWEKVPAKIKAANIQLGEKYLGYNWPQIKATLYLEYVRSGNLAIMKAPYEAKKEAFQNLVMAELMEGKGRFLDDIINGVWDLCEMTYWGPTSHLGLQKAGFGLPDVDDPTIGIGAASTAASLAWAYHFFKADFDKISPLVNKRIKKEIYDKVLQPYYTRDDIHWWLGFKPGGRVNNWNPWCNFYVLNCILLLEEDPELKRENVYKVMRSVDNFINYYDDDGGCEEGPEYWNNAGGKLFDVLELLHKATKGHVDIYNEEIIKNIGNYIYKVYINDQYFINFADASNKLSPRAEMIFRYGSRINDPVMKGFGAFLARKRQLGESAVKGETVSALEDLFLRDKILSYPPSEPLIKSFWMSGTEIAGAREQEGTKKGFYFAAKGGHNYESHNHNDAGHFILYYNGQPAIVDAGVGTYTSKTFSGKRYEIWTMQSGYHNLPVINGEEQKPGREFKASKVNFTDEGRTARFEADLSSAYPESAGVKSWKRVYELNRSGSFSLTDAFDLKEVKGTTSLNFLSSCKVEEVTAGEARLIGKDFELRMIWDPTQYEFKAEKIDLEDKKLKKAWPEGLQRILLVRLGTSMKGSSQVLFTKK